MIDFYPPHTADISRTKRRRRGKDLRQKTPHKSHDFWQAMDNRPDPLSLLQAQDTGRVQHLLPIKYGRMLASPFSYLRGSAVVMAADLAHTPSNGLEVILCGDAHLSNFGFYASPERHLVFDLNDFDETHPGPWEWDLKRLAASAAVAGRHNGFSDKTNRNLAKEVAKVYRQAMHHFSEMRTIDVWYYQLDSETLKKYFDTRSSKKMRKEVEKVIEKSRSKTHAQTIKKLTIVDENGDRLIKANLPLLVPYRTQNLSQFVDIEDMPFVTKDSMSHIWERYLSSLDDERRFLLSRYQIVDGAFRVGGVGSVGTRCTIFLLQGGADDDGLILQLKEAGPSALAAYLPDRPFKSQAQRVVTGQQLMQTTNDIFLGWHNSEISGHDYYWRQLKDMKGSIDVEKMDKSGAKTYVQICALCLARAHARTGDSSAIAGYLGNSKRFDSAIADFAIAYADQTEQDFQKLMSAVKAGKIKAETGI